MPSINMIAPRRAEKRRMEQAMRRLAVVIIAELIIAVGISGWVCTRFYTTKNRIAEINTEIAKLQPIVKQIEEYEKNTNKLKPKIELLNQAKDCTMLWYNTLDKLTQNIPQSTYLTKLSTAKDNANKDASQTTVCLNGVSESQAKVGEIMVRMHAIPEFSNVNLHFTQQTVIKEASGYEFEIGATMKQINITKGAKADGDSQS